MSCTAWVRVPLVGSVVAILFVIGVLGTAAVRAERLVPAVCFAPGTPADQVEIVTAEVDALGYELSLGDPQPFQFDDGQRWSSTATDGGGLGQGDPITLTWSIVPDGTSIFGYIAEPIADSDLRAFLNSIYGSQAVWLPLFEQVFDRWSELTGITYVYEPNDDGSDWTQLGIAGGSLGVRGDIRIAGHPIDGNSGVLAYNFFPNFGDMVIDTADASFTFTANDSLLLRNTLAHEHGHGLGIDHVCPLEGTKLMEPILALGFDGPQHDDILAAQRGYGDRFEHNDTPGGASNLGSLAPGDSEIDDVSIDDNADDDLYRFTVDAPVKLGAELDPIGFTYLSGPQVGSCMTGSSFNSLPIHDLQLRVLDGSLTPLATVDANGEGAGESLSDLQLPSAGQYYLEVTGDNTDAAQLYRLELALAEGLAIFTDGFESGNVSAWALGSP